MKNFNKIISKQNTNTIIDSAITSPANFDMQNITNEQAEQDNYEAYMKS